MKLQKNKIYKLSEIAEDLKQDYFSKLEKLQITKEQADILYNIACAATGFYADAIETDSIADDAVYNVKTHAMYNVLQNVFKIKIDKFDLWDLLKSRLKYECVYEFEDETSYLFIQIYDGENDNFDYIKNGVWYLILADDEALDTIINICTDSKSFGKINIKTEQAADNKELISKINELGLDTSYYFR